MPTASALVPAAPRAPSIWVLPQAADLRQEGQDDRRRVALRRFLKSLRADQHADVEQDRQDRDHRDQRHHQRDHAEPGQHDHQQAGRGRVADAAAHRLPARMADIDRVDEWIAHEAADQAHHAVRRQHPRGRERIARGRGALHVVHRLDEIVDAEWDRGDEDDAQKLEAGEHVVHCRQRYRKAEIADRAEQGADAEIAVVEAERGGNPRRRRCRRRWRPGRPARRAGSARRRTSWPG